MMHKPNTNLAKIHGDSPRNEEIPASVWTTIGISLFAFSGTGIAYITHLLDPLFKAINNPTISIINSTDLAAQICVNVIGRCN